MPNILHMSLLRLPTPLRRAILSQRPSIIGAHRGLTTSVNTIVHDELLLPPAANTQASGWKTTTSHTLNSYTISNPPNGQQLKYTASFFHSAPPQILFSAAAFRSFPPSSSPEVAFLGRSNVGKSSLLNALFGRTKEKVAHVSKKAGRTRTMNGFGITGGLHMGSLKGSGAEKERWRAFPLGGLVVVDMPGYGSGSREIWGKEALKYLEQRKQLRRTFILLDAQVGLKSSDITILTHLRRAGISHQIILSKVDKLLHDGSKPSRGPKLEHRLARLHDLCSSIRSQLNAEANDGRDAVGDILCCSAEMTFEGTGHRKMGIDEVRWAVLSACGMESDMSGNRRRPRMEDVHVLEDDI